jgi:hypothetical protein
MRILEPHMSVSAAASLRLTGHTKQDRLQQSAKPLAAIVQIYTQFIYCYLSALLRADTWQLVIKLRFDAPTPSKIQITVA